MSAAQVTQLRPAPPPVKREEITYDSTNERVIIEAAIATDKAGRSALVRSVPADRLRVPEHVVIWRALRVLVDQGLEYTPDVMRRLVADEGGRVESQYLSELEENASVSENLEQHLAWLHWDSTRVQLLEGPLPELVRALKSPKASRDTIMGLAQALMRGLDNGGGRRFIRNKKELARSYKAELAARVAMGNFYPFGYEAMDRRLSEGAMPKRTAVIAGLSGSGKSTYTAGLALNLAHERRRVLYGCWEMPSESMLDVMVASMTRIPLEKIVQGHLTPAEKARCDKTTDYITSRITFMDNPFFAERKKGRRRSNEENQDILEGYIAESGCDVGIYDLWERMLVDTNPGAVAEALFAQQNMHERYNMYGVICQQLNLKDVERRPDKRPTRESIKGTGAYVEVADQVFGIHREGQHKDVPDDSLEVICLKQRKGKAFWATRFNWYGELALVTGGEDVKYDPGLAASSNFGGDVGEIKSGHRRKTARREG